MDDHRSREQLDDAERGPRTIFVAMDRTGNAVKVHPSVTLLVGTPGLEAKLAIRQFYGPAGVPLIVEGDPGEPAVAWRRHRARVRDWLDALPDSEWVGPTRCGLWNVTALVRHLASGSQFLGYTLHQSARGEATTLLRGFDPHETVQTAAAKLGDMTPATAREAVAQVDASADAELDKLSGSDWTAMAEAPPGRLPASLAVNHFLFDSWVHEYDLMVPRGERPTMDPFEARMVVRYLVGLASVETSSDVALDLRLTEPDLRIGLTVVGGAVRVMDDSVPKRAAVVEGSLVDVVDRYTGRPAGAVHGDQRALAVLDGFGQLLAG